MSKRKLDALEALEAANPSAPTSVKRQRKNLLAVLAAGQKQLFRALKLARGFERQKLGRRTKSNKSKKEGRDVARLEAEVAALKSLDLDKAAETHLAKCLVKTKAVAEHAALPEEIRQRALTEGPKDVATANVTARMYKSNPVLEAMEQVVGTVGRTLGLKGEDVKVKKRMRKADYEAAAAGKSNDTEEGNGTQSRQSDGPLKPNDAYVGSDEHDGESFSGFSDSNGTGLQADFNSEDEDVQMDQGSEADFNSEDEDKFTSSARPSEFKSEDEDEDVSFDGMELSDFDDRIASDSEDGDDDDDDDEEEGITFKDPAVQKLYASQLSTADLSSGASDNSASASPEPRKRLSQTAAPQKPTTTTHFLPSLGTGYLSGSDSEASDVSAAALPKKNRMGQRARQAVWEKKYGHDAKHLKAGGKPQGRDSGWDARRGATDGHTRKPWEQRRGRGRGDSRGGGGFRSRERPVKVPEPPVVEKIPTYGSAHPSWLAKQAAKEKASVAAKPAGKKITFD